MNIAQPKPILNASVPAQLRKIRLELARESAPRRRRGHCLYHRRPSRFRRPDRSGEYVSINEEGKMHTYRVVTVRPL